MAADLMADETLAPPPATEDTAANAPPGRRRIRRRWVVVAVALAVVAGIGIWQGLSARGSSNDVLTGGTGRPAPAFSLPVLTDPAARLSLSSFHGKDLVVNFWASWCVPCRTEMPLLESAYRKVRSKVAFLGIATNDTPAAARTFLSEVHVTYSAVSDQNAAVATAYGVYGLPTTVFISPSGKVLGRHVGQLHSTTLDEALKEAFDVSP
jgi:cytochrome c biogenesis protein CcmG/thiol:disulfide interchange protein DsbE